MEGMDGEVDAVIHHSADGSAWEVEFVTAKGATLAVLTLSATDNRPMGNREILHAQELAPR